MPIFKLFPPAIALVFVAMINPAGAREIVVAMPGDRAHPAIAAAIQDAADGDTVRVGKGVYCENIVIDKRIALIGERGAVIDPSQPLLAEWKPAPQIGRGVYRAAVPRRPRTLLLGGKIVAAIDQRRTDADGPWSWKRLLASGPPRSGFQYIRAVWIYIADEKAAFVHLADDANPAALEWSAIWSAEPAILVRKAEGARIASLAVAHACTAVKITDHARRCTVEDCVLGPWDMAGVMLGDGAADCLVQRNDIFRGSYEDWTPVDTSKERYEIWLIHKQVGFYDRVGVDLVRAGARNRVHANHVHDTFDGIDIGDSSVESLDIPLADPNAGQSAEIDENLIERTRDSGIELGVGCIDVRVHHNIIRQSHGGLRYKLPRVGPVFIYRNVLEGGMPFNIWYSMDDSPAEGYVYHNTIVGGRYGLMYSSFVKPHHIGAPHWHYLNNLVIAQQGFFHDSKTGTPVNFTADYNVVAGGSRPWPDARDRDQHSRYVDHVDLTSDLRPKPGTPAIDAGLDLSTYYHGRPLPGCEGRAYKGQAPDAGAYEVE